MPTPADRKISRPTAGAPGPGPQDFPSDSYPEHLALDRSDPPEPAPEDFVQAWRDFEEAERARLEEEEPLYGAGSWRPAPAISRLFMEANAANPDRDRRSDGIVGDLRHQARKSGHNPDARGVVVAGDVDVDGLDTVGAVERARVLAHAGKLPQLAYIIFAGRITAPDFSHWREYDGENPHVTHSHWEVGHEPERADDARPWNVWTAPRPATARPAPTTPRNAPPAPTTDRRDLRGSGLDLRGEEGARGPRVAALQGWLSRTFPAYARGLAADGVWGPRTSAVVREFARRCGITADGRNIGPQLARRLAGYRFRA